MKNKILQVMKLFFIFILWTNIIWSAPDLPDPEGKKTVDFTNIDSDYGPRNVSTKKKIHFGIDYNDIKGTKPGLAVEDGKLITLYRFEDKDTDRYNRHLIVGSWKYFHPTNKSLGTIYSVYHQTKIETSDTSKFTIVKGKKQLNKNKQKILVFRDGTGNVLNAFSIENNFQFIDKVLNKRVTTKDDVKQGDIIFYSGWHHLHLENVDKTINPLSRIYHIDDNPPIVTLRLGTNKSSTFQEITDGKIYGKGIIEAKIDTTKDKDLNEIHFMYKPENEGEKNLEEGDIIYTSQTKCSVKEIFTADTTEVKIKKKVAEGCYPVYMTVGCGLDYFKYNWFTKQQKGTKREDKKEAKNPDPNNAEGPKYPDGKYEIIVKAKDITEKHEGQNSKFEVLIDNYRPSIM